MNQICKTVKVKTDATDNEQGFVVINESDYDHNVHTLADADDADHPEGAKKLSVVEIREALTAKGIDIPEGAKKAELMALLNANP